MSQANVRNDLYVWKGLSESREPNRKQLGSKMVNNSQSERSIVLWLRYPLDHFLIQIQKPTRIAKNKLPLITEFEGFGRSAEQSAFQPFLKPLDFKGNSRLRAMQPF